MLKNSSVDSPARRRRRAWSLAVPLLVVFCGCAKPLLRVGELPGIRVADDLAVQGRYAEIVPATDHTLTEREEDNEPSVASQVWEPEVQADLAPAAAQSISLTVPDHALVRALVDAPQGSSLAVRLAGGDGKTLGEGVREPLRPGTDRILLRVPIGAAQALTLTVRNTGAASVKVRAALGYSPAVAR